MESFAQLPLWRQLVVVVPFMGLLIASSYTDLKERKIYNKLTYPFFFVGLVLHGVAFGPFQAWHALLAALITFGICFLLFVFLPRGVFGGGDVKLLTVTAAFFGSGIGIISFYAILCGGIMGLVWAFFSGYALTVFKNIYYFLKGLILGLAYRSKSMTQKMEPDDERSKFPFAIAILFGTLAAIGDAVFGWYDFYELFLSSLRPPN